MTDKRADLLALAERVEAGSGKDRNLDADIFQRLGGPDWERALIRVAEPCGCPEDQAIDYARSRHSPDYTVSLDAAVALLGRVLPGWSWQAGATVGAGAVARIAQDGLRRSDGVASSPARALLAATLRALAQKEQTT
jgi:hypothetical protein